MSTGSLTNDFVAYDDDEESYMRSRQKPKSNKRTIFIIVAVMLLVGLIAVLFYKYFKKSSKASQKPSKTKPAPPPNPHVVEMGHPRDTTTAPKQFKEAEMKAMTLWTTTDMAYLGVLDSDTMSKLFVESIDRTTLELRHPLGAKIISEMPGRSNPMTLSQASLMIMVYQSNCGVCLASAPLFAAAAKAVEQSHMENPTTPPLKFAVVDYHDIPVYITNHLPRETPAFILYDGKDDLVKIVNVADLATLSEQIVLYYENHQ